MPKVYIGDGAYVEQDADGTVTLTTENGHVVTNRVVLEPVVLIDFLSFLLRHSSIVRTWVKVSSQID